MSDNNRDDNWDGDDEEKTFKEAPYGSFSLDSQGIHEFVLENVGSSCEVDGSLSDG